MRRHHGMSWPSAAIAATLLAAAPASSQSPDVVAVVLQQLRVETSTDTDVVFDRVPLNVTAAREHQATTGEHEALLLDAVERIDGVRVGSSSDVVRCAEPHPRSCRLIGTELLVAVAPPVIDGARATLDTYVRYPSTSKRQPVGSRGYRFHLELRQDRWVIARRILLSES